MMHAGVPVSDQDGSGALKAAASAELGSGEFAVIAKIMQRDARIHLTEAKTTLVQSRLSRRLRTHGLATFRDFAGRPTRRYLGEHPENQVATRH